jgi:hypothetical protein
MGSAAGRALRLAGGAAAGIALGLLIVRLRPSPLEAHGAARARVAVPGPATLDPAGVQDARGAWLCRALYRSALTYDAEGRLVAQEADELSVHHTLRLAFRPGAAPAPEALRRILIERVLPRPDERLLPLFVRRDGRVQLLSAPVLMPDGTLELSGTAPLHAAARALEELLTPRVVDPEATRPVDIWRLKFRDAATAARFHRRAEELRRAPFWARGAAAVERVESPQPEVLLICSAGGLWPAAQPWCCPPVVFGGAAPPSLALAGSYADARERFERGEVDAALTIGAGAPTGLIDRQILGLNAGRLPDVQTRRRIRDRRRLDGAPPLALLVRRSVPEDLARAREWAAALGPAVRVEPMEPSRFDEAIGAGRFDLFVGSIVTGPGADLWPWFDARTGRLSLSGAEARRLLEALDVELDPARRRALEERLWSEAAAEGVAITLDRRPIVLLGRLRAP